jgi:hypothetical protein
MANTVLCEANPEAKAFQSLASKGRERAGERK